MHGRDADAAADAHDMARGLAVLAADGGGAAKRPENRRDIVAFVQLGQLHGGRPHGLEDQCDRSRHGIRVADCQRDPLAKLVIDHQDDELPRLALARDDRSFNVQPEYIVGQLPFMDDFVHDFPF